MGNKVGLLDADPNHAVGDWHEVGQLPGITIASDITEQNIGDEVAKLEDGGADFVIIDLPGMRGMVQVFAFGLSDLIIIPTQTSRSDVEQALGAGPHDRAEPEDDPECQGPASVHARLSQLHDRGRCPCLRAGCRARGACHE